MSSNELAQSLKEVFKERVLGPEYPIISRINNYYLKQIILKTEKELSQHQIKVRLQEIIDHFYSIPSNKSTKVVVDVDPY